MHGNEFQQQVGEQLQSNDLGSDDTVEAVGETPHLRQHNSRGIPLQPCNSSPAL
jgi:hypothetical protein